MRKKILAVAGSPRRNGNSESLLDAAIEGARDAGAEVEKLVLNEMNIAPCQNCGYCSKHRTCRIADDMTQVCAGLEEANAIIIASPIYFGSLTAQTKMMIDRCQPYWARKYLFHESRGPLGQECLFLSCCGFKTQRAESFFANADTIVDVWCTIMDIRCRAKLHFRGLDERGDAQKQPDALEKATAAGRELVVTDT